MMESSPLQQGHSTSYSRENMTVLNAASHSVLERTIVESFVKLVVCRKMTVQRVAAASGHVLDSHTTQEEDSPVILDVHRHEIGGVCSVWGSNLRSPSVSGSDCLPHSSQPPSPSSVNLGDDDDRRQQEEFFDDSDCHIKDINCDPSQGNGVSSDHLCKSSNVDSLHSKQKKSHSAGNDHFKTGNSCQPTAFGNTKVKTEKSTQQECGKENTKFDTLTHCKKRKIDQVDVSDGFVPDKEQDEDPKLKENLSPAETSESSEGDRIDRVKQRGGSTTLTETQLSLSVCNEITIDPGTDMPAVSETEKKINSRSENMDEQESMSFDKMEDLMEDSSAEMKPNEESGKRSEKCTESETGAEKQTESEGQEKWTKHISDSLDENGDLGMGTSVQETSGAVPEGHSVLSVVADEGQCESLQSDNPDEQINTDIESKGQPHINDHEAVEDQEDVETLESETASETNSQPQKYGEDDSEQDTLVIDISNSMSEQTDQNTDDDSAISACDQVEQKSAEKPDPFLHLLNNFPLLDRNHDKVSIEQERQTKPESVRRRTTENITAVHSSVAVKDELDDDCMITAAFISSNRKKTGPRFKPVSHSVTSDIMAMSAGSNREWRGRYFARAPFQRRHSMGQYTQGHLPSVQQFPQALHGFQVNQNVTAAAAGAVAARGATGYPSLLSSQTELSLPHDVTPPASQPYIPNFLATTPQAGEGLDTGSVPAVLGDRALPIDHSQQTYQCAICNRIFLHKYKFDEHMSKCGAHRPYKCRICAKGFNQRAHLDTHIKFHMGIKRYRCDVCHKAYVMKGDLIRHLKTRGHSLTVQAQSLPVQDCIRSLPVQDSARGLSLQDSVSGLSLQDADI